LAETKAWLRRGQSINTRGKRRFPLEAGAIGSKMYRAAYVQRVHATGWEDR
jgi:hypothetical protein